MTYGRFSKNFSQIFWPKAREEKKKKKKKKKKKRSGHLKIYFKKKKKKKQQTQLTVDLLAVINSTKKIIAYICIYKRFTVNFKHSGLYYLAALS